MFLCQNHTNVLCVWYVCPVYHLTPYVPPTSHPMYDPPHSLWTASHFVYHLTPCVLPHTLCTTSLLVYCLTICVPPHSLCTASHFVYHLTPCVPPHSLWTASLLVDRLTPCGPPHALCGPTVSHAVLSCMLPPPPLPGGHGLRVLDSGRSQPSDPDGQRHTQLHQTLHAAVYYCHQQQPTPQEPHQE